MRLITAFAAGLSGGPPTGEQEDRSSDYANYYDYLLPHG